MFAARELLTGAHPPVIFDSAGANTSANKGGSSTGVGTISWSHTLGSGANAIAVLVSTYFNGVSTVTAKIGTTNIPSVYSNNYNNVNGHYWVYVFGLLAPPTGAQTVAVSSTNFSSAWELTADSIAAQNVGSFGAGQANTGTGTANSQTVTSAAGQLITQIFTNAVTTASTSYSAYNQTSTANIVGTPSQPCVIGYAAGAPSVSFTATHSTSIAWAGGAVPLIPA